MDESEYDIHPLDRDYSEPIPTRPRAERTFEERFRLSGVTVFATGFVLLLIVAAMLGTVQGVGWVESFGSVVHRFAMLLILAGGVMIVVSYRLPEISRRSGSLEVKSQSSVLSQLGLLFACNILFLILIAMVSASSSWIGTPPWRSTIFNGLITIGGALMVTLIIWHRGPVRAFAVGVAAGLVISFFTGLFAFNYRPMNQSESWMVIARLASIQIAGLASATYVALFTKQTDPGSEP